MELIALKNLSFAYPGGRTVFAGLDFCLNEHQRVGILGPNGAGKSTMFQLAMGLLRPDQGQIFGLGHPCSGENDFRALRQAVGYLFQDSDDQLFCPTVLEDVAFGPLNLGRGHHQSRHIAAECLEMLGLAGFERRVTYRLSGGEKRLVALASVLAMSPRALLLDEPTTGLDEIHTDLLFKALLSLDIGWAIISHDQAVLGRLCPEVLILKDGRIQPTS